MLSLIVCLFLASSLSFAESEKTQSVTGKIEFEDSVNEGDVYLFVASHGGSFLPKDAAPDAQLKPEKNAKVAAPDLSSRWISVGRKSGKNLTFDVNLKKGTYQLGCIVKKSKPDCDELTINKEKIITRCYPGKDDSICDQLQVEVLNRNLYEVTLRAGAPVTEKP